MPRTWSGLSAAALLIVWLGASRPAYALEPQKPLWEFGLGIGALGFPDYRGSDTSHVYPLPIPYFIYRGRFLRADRDGVRGLLLNRKVVELTISVNATTPVRSRDSAARRGMPDLRPTIELGPSLNVHLWRSTDRPIRLDLRMPLRGAVTVESSPQYIGWFFAPQLNLDLTDFAGRAGWNLGLAAGPLFADRRYDDYFYSVAPRFAAVNRPAYEARGGYSGSQMLAAMSKRFSRYWVGAFVRYDVLGGAAFSESPLVRSNHYWAAGVGIAWMIGQSSTLVDFPDEHP